MGAWNGRCTGRAITLWLLLWGAVNQLVLSVANPTLSFLPIWLCQTLWYQHTHNQTLTATIPVHTSLKILTCLLCLSFKHTVHTLHNESVVSCRPYAKCFGTYLHRWQCRCCWKLSCTDLVQAQCGGGGRFADPTESQLRTMIFIRIK